MKPGAAACSAGGTRLDGVLAQPRHLEQLLRGRRCLVGGGGRVSARCGRSRRLDRGGAPRRLAAARKGPARRRLPPDPAPRSAAQRRAPAGPARVRAASGQRKKACNQKGASARRIAQRLRSEAPHAPRRVRTASVASQRAPACAARAARRGCAAAKARGAAAPRAAPLPGVATARAVGAETCIMAVGRGLAAGVVRPRTARRRRGKPTFCRQPHRASPSCAYCAAFGACRRSSRSRARGVSAAGAGCQVSRPRDVHKAAEALAAASARALRCCARRTARGSLGAGLRRARPAARHPRRRRALGRILAAAHAALPRARSARRTQCAVY
jgi:hypothetical protein